MNPDRQIPPSSAKNQSANPSVAALHDTLEQDGKDMLIKAGIDEFKVSLLEQLFGTDYINTNASTIASRWQEIQHLTQQITKHDNQYTSAYDKVVVTGGLMDTPYNSQFEKYNSHRIQYFRKLNDTITIDLFSQGLINLFSISVQGPVRPGQKEHMINDYLINASTLVYVDLQNNNSSESIQRVGDSQERKQVKVKSDALEFISLLPDNSVSYIISGFDDYVVKAYMDLGKAYIEKLNQEVYRTTHRGGVVLGVNFERKDGLQDIGMSDIIAQDSINNNTNFYCYQKGEQSPME